MKILKVIPVLNKKNGQINFSLPKKKLSLSMREKILKVKQMKIRIEDLK